MPNLFSKRGLENIILWIAKYHLMSSDNRPVILDLDSNEVDDKMERVDDILIFDYSPLSFLAGKMNSFPFSLGLSAFFSLF
jgi:hypothetical protein